MTPPKKPVPPARQPPTRPRGNGNFLVDLGGGLYQRAPEAGFCEVIFPELWLAPADDVQTPQSAPPWRNPHLVLRRAATGALDLVGWWTQARAATKPPRRSVTVTLLADDATTPVMRWRFEGACPVALTYSPLNAQSPDLLYETVALAFRTVAITGAD